MCFAYVCHHSSFIVRNSMAVRLACFCWAGMGGGGRDGRRDEVLFPRSSLMHVKHETRGEGTKVALLPGRWGLNESGKRASSTLEKDSVCATWHLYPFSGEECDLGHTAYIEHKYVFPPGKKGNYGGKHGIALDHR